MLICVEGPTSVTERRRGVSPAAASRDRSVGKTSEYMSIEEE
jgi:hypothetical protein